MAAQQQVATAAPRKGAKVQVANTNEINQAAAVAMAAEQLIPSEKPFNKMNAAEKKVYLAKK